MVIRTEDTYSHFQLLFWSSFTKLLAWWLQFFLLFFCALTFSTFSHLILFEWVQNSQNSNKTPITNPIIYTFNTLFCTSFLGKLLTILSFVGDTDSETPAEVVEEGASLAKSERSHLVVWQVAINQSSNQKTQY